MYTYLGSDPDLGEKGSAISLHYRNEQNGKELTYHVPAPPENLYFDGELDGEALLYRSLGEVDWERLVILLSGSKVFSAVAATSTQAPQLSLLYGELRAALEKGRKVAVHSYWSQVKEFMTSQTDVLSAIGVEWGESEQAELDNAFLRCNLSDWINLPYPPYDVRYHGSITDYREKYPDAPSEMDLLGISPPETGDDVLSEDT